MHRPWLVALVLPIATSGAVARASCLSLGGRRGSDTCWVEYRPSPGNITCISRALWREWLESDSPTLWCDSVQGALSIVSPPENGISPHQPKVSYRVFKPDRLPAVKGPHRLLARPIHFIERLRESVSSLLEPWDDLGILRASLLSERRRLDPLGLIRRMGFIHLMSASGIHLYAISRIWGAILLLAAETLEIPGPIALPLIRGAILLGWVSAWWLGGARAGMLRPWILIGSRRLARRLGIRLRSWVPLIVALSLDLAYGAIFDAPFRLRFRIDYALAVGGGILLESRSEGSRRPLKTYLSLCLGSWIFASLWDASRTGAIALATPLLSVLSLPVICGIVFPLTLSIGLLNARNIFLGMLVLSPAESFVRFLLACSMRFETLWLVPRASLTVGILLSWAVASLLRSSSRRQRARSLLAVALLAVRVGCGAGSDPSALAEDVEQLDVGQGDAALVRGSRSAGLIDSGSEAALADEDWVALFSERGISRLRWVALTHLDEDHSGGVKRLSLLMPIGCVVTSAGELESDRGLKYAAELARSGIRIGDWSSPCVPYPTLAPPFTAASGPRAKNQNMGAVLVPLAGHSVYLSAGDAEGGDEERIGRWARDRIESGGMTDFRRILKLSHHGSSTSSSRNFLDTVSPDLVIVSAGQGNRYGHPSWTVLDRLRRKGLEIFRTDRDGAVDIASLKREDGLRPARTHPP